MSSAIDIDLPTISATVLAGALPIPSPQPVSQALLRITIPDFHFDLATRLTDKLIIETTRATAQATFDEHVKLLLLMTGKVSESGTKFCVEKALLQIRSEKEFARANFVISTLNALMALAEEVHFAIPDIVLDLDLSFDLSLLEISKFLQIRQTAYRLMVIEQATNIEFSFPLQFSSEEVASILFVYRAIVDRCFTVPGETYPISILANEESLNRIRTLSEPAPISFIEEQFSEYVLGRKVFLGNMKVTIEDGIIENREEVYNELARLDGHEVRAVVRSASRRFRCELAEAPSLPNNPWDSNIQLLVDLESQLDDRLIERYNALAADTLADLTEEEKAAVTTRPELDEEAFFIEGWNREDS